MEEIWAVVRSYLGGIYLPEVKLADILDILIIAYILYHLFLWIKTSRAWTLLKGIFVLGLFMLIAEVLKMNTILWITHNLINVILLALVILFQPELRSALDELGRKNFVTRIFSSMNNKNSEEKGLSDKTIYELVKTCTKLGKDKTGALIVIEQDTPLGEYVRTGIQIEALVSQQLLINIFEKNTPLHDGAVIIQKNRVTAATCYLPLTSSQDIAKALGTRHRAGIGVSEVTDSMTIIVSEETGGVSVAYRGTLYQDLDEDGLRRQLSKLQGTKEEKSTRILKRKGVSPSEKVKEK
ncbi:MAG: diadenylate cyclase CdaA [Eubacterium sp.]|nr:diadenylate cyclase CdaA [Eubacterium sp.]